MMMFKHCLQVFLQDESGQDLVEYALIVACVMLAAIATMQKLVGSITTVFNAVRDTFTSAF